MTTVAQRWIRTLFYVFWGVCMTALTYVLGAAPLRLLRARAGREVYWLLGFSTFFLLFLSPAKALGLAFLSLILLIGVFSELEEVGFGLMMSGFFTILINGLISGGTFLLWATANGPKWIQYIQGGLEATLKPLVELNPKYQVNYHDLMLQLPSVIIILWLGALYLAVLLESRLGRRSTAMRAQLAEFRLPDAVIWMFILSLLGAFAGIAPKWIEAVAVNGMNICLALFFFQGIAVVGRFFVAARMGLFWQVLFMVLIVVHLFLVVSLLGLVDYWVDFRTRMSKRAEQFNRET